MTAGGKVQIGENLGPKAPDMRLATLAKAAVSSSPSLSAARTTQEVAGSSPIAPTDLSSKTRGFTRRFCLPLANLLRYTRSHAVPGVSNDGYSCSAGLPYLSTP
jgi:hypothetical protein